MVGSNSEVPGSTLEVVGSTFEVQASTFEVRRIIGLGVVVFFPCG